MREYIYIRGHMYIREYIYIGGCIYIRGYIYIKRYILNTYKAMQSRQIGTSFPPLPPRPVVRSPSDLRGRVRYVRPILHISFSSSIAHFPSLNSLRKRKKSRDNHVSFDRRHRSQTLSETA